MFVCLLTWLCYGDKILILSCSHCGSDYRIYLYFKAVKNNNFFVLFILLLLFGRGMS